MKTAVAAMSGLLTVSAWAGAVCNVGSDGSCNLSFEQPVLTSGDFDYIGVDPSAQQVGWTFSGMTGVASNSSAFTALNANAPQGSQVALIQNSGSISQSFSGFTSGTQYALSFLAADRADDAANGYGTQSLVVSLDGATVGTVTGAQLTSAYQTFTINLTPAELSTNSSHTISFSGTNSAGATVFFDNVSFAAAAPVVSGPSLGVPEPATFGFLSLGLALMGACGFRRRKLD